ncbi:MAG: hypothetical protein K1X74_15050 [Pirellulales bacterium]|nr:hypothetical protein [Pirellulales bacterium]
MRTQSLGILVVGLLLTVATTAGAYAGWLGQRSDYLGHFLAGCGGTLGVAVLALLAISGEIQRRAGATVVLLAVLACVALGGVFESTLYRLAKFDEVDFCNQSLGAVVAGAIAQAVARRGLLTRMASVVLLALAAALLFGGYHFAFL